VLARDFVVLLLTVFLVVLAYSGTLWVLEQLAMQLDYVYLPPAMLLGLILTFLLAMLLITNTISALGCLYFSHDLSLILSSPISGRRFFFGKFLDTALSSSWMTLIFLSPVLIAFGVYYQANWGYYALASVLCIPYFTIPAAVSIVTATFFVVSIPVRHRKEAAILSFLAMVFGLYVLGGQILGGVSAGKEAAAGDLLRIVSFLSLSNKSWTPAYWVSALLGDSLEGSTTINFTIVKLLVFSTLASISAAFVSLACFFELGYARAMFTGKRTRKEQRHDSVLSKILIKLLGLQTKALVQKEYRIITRDVTQAVQFILLLGICGLYIYSLTIQDLFTQVVPQSQERWWKSFLIVINLCVEAFVVTAMGSRFVFPSVSKEGKSFWVMRTAPMMLEKVLAVKFGLWLLVISLTSGIVFGSATYLVTGEIWLAFLKAVSNFVLSIGIVGLAVGLGAFFSNFRFEHIGQLTTSFGSLIYMLSSISLIVCNIVLGFVAFYFMRSQVDAGLYQFASLVLALFLIMLLFNGIIAALMLRLGKKALLREL
jgi:ABC-2 type transport system permease protein